MKILVLALAIAAGYGLQADDCTEKRVSSWIAPVV